MRRKNGCTGSVDAVATCYGKSRRMNLLIRPQGNGIRMYMAKGG
jgi:hypothetical protein